MRLINSACTSLLFPKSRKSIDEFRCMADFLAGRRVDCIEFYHDGDGRGQIGNILHDVCLDAVYIAVIPSKEQKLYLCDEAEEGRVAAVRLFERCIDEAEQNGIGEVMINSGHIGKSVEAGVNALVRSVEELYEYIAKKGYSTQLFIEPCDSAMYACQLIGPTSRTLAFVERIRAAGYPMSLTMDSAHTAEEGEDFLEAVTAVRPYCNHIHFANCDISDPSSPLYGDQHLGFEYPNTVWTPETLKTFFEAIGPLYPSDSVLRIGLEVLCRTDDPYAYFDAMWDSLPFLHRKQVD